MNLNKKQIILGFLILVSMSIPFFSTSSLKFNYVGKIFNSYEYTLRSSQWVVSSPIIVNETDPTGNWATIAASEPWCSGSGIWTDPYIIEDVTIDLQGADASCISVYDSNVHFQIKECTLINAGWGTYGSAGIYLDNTNNGQLLNNNCSNHNYNGIYLSNSDNNTISGNVVLNNQMGIELDYCHYNYITGNAVNSNNIGIDIRSSDNNTVSGNVLSFNKNGIILSSIENCTVTGNVMSSCGITVSIRDYELDDFMSNVIDISNTVNGKPVYYFTSRNNLGNSDFTNPGQIILLNCTDCFLSNLDITYTSQGIQVLFCDNIAIYSSDFTNNMMGIAVQYGSFINITDNTVSNNEAGISLYGGENCTISGNTVNDNSDLLNFWGYGINVGDSENCTISDNTANNNHESGLNVWYSEDLAIIGNTFNYNRYGIKTSEIVDCEIEGNIINGAGSFADNWDVGIGLFTQYGDDSADNTLKNNLMTNCGLLLGYGAKLEHMTSQDIDDSNLVNGNPLYYYTNQIGLIPTDFSNAGQIFLINTNTSVIDNLLFSNTTVGIQMFYSHGNTISNCEFKHNKQNSFELMYSDNNEILGNTFSDSNQYHLWLECSNGNTITDNSITDDPVMNPNPGIILGNCNNSFVLRNDISDCYVGIMANGDYNTFSDNNLSNNVDYGLYVGWSKYNTITNNTLNGNSDGLTLESSDYNNIMNNTMNDNREYGADLFESNYNTVTDNIFRCNGYGCWIDEGGFGNTINSNICEECTGNGNGGGPGGVPGYNIFLIIGIIGVISALLLRKRYKH